MNLKDIVENLGLTVMTGAGRLDAEVRGGYASDLLSDVMGHAKEGQVWVTLQIHQNIVAVAVMKSLVAILLVNGRQPEEETVAKAEAEGVPILISPLPAFELAGRLYNLGVSGL